MEPLNESHHATHKYDGISKVKQKNRFIETKKNVDIVFPYCTQVTQNGGQLDLAQVNSVPLCIATKTNMSV